MSSLHMSPFWVPFGPSLVILAPSFLLLGLLSFPLVPCGGCVGVFDPIPWNDPCKTIGCTIVKPMFCEKHTFLCQYFGRLENHDFLAFGSSLGSSRGALAAPEGPKSHLKILRSLPGLLFAPFACLGETKRKSVWERVANWQR